MLGEFKKFLLRGNAVDLAVGTLIGAAFGDIVKSLTGGIIQPLLSLAGGKPDVSLKLWVFDLGMVINAIIGFVIIAAIIFFIIVKPMNTLLSRLKKEEAPAPPPPSEVLLMEIRDLLAKQVK